MKQGSGNILDFLWSTYVQCGMYDWKGHEEKKERQNNLTKIRGESGWTSPKNEVYNAWMEKIGICKWYSIKNGRLGLFEKMKRKKII